MEELAAIKRLATKNKQIHTIYRTKQRITRLLYLLDYLKRGPPCPNSRWYHFSIGLGSVEVDSTHKKGRKWENGVNRMSSLRVMVSQGLMGV